MLQFGGFAILPFALLIMSGDTHGSPVVGEVAAALGFLLVGLGMHMVQTAGLALATDLAPEESRPRVVALLYVMLLVGMAGSAALLGLALDPFSQIGLIQTVQGAAVLTLLINMVALWKQEPRSPARTAHDLPRPRFRQAWAAFAGDPGAIRLLVALALGTAGFTMQDILLEPYGAQILGLSVAATTALTAILAGATLVGLAIAAPMLARGADPFRLAALGALIGLPAFSMIVMAAPIGSADLFRGGVALLGLGGGLFAVGMLTAAMKRTGDGSTTVGAGLVLGAFGAVQATAAGLAIALGAALRDGFTALAGAGLLGPAVAGPTAAYGVVYHLELVLLFATLIAIGPLARPIGQRRAPSRFGLADVPG
jgi:BCD family chlorophyll transporter-like MFS transporter